MFRRFQSSRVFGAACWVALVFLTITVPAGAGESQYIRQHYTKYEYRIPMRDGVRLFTAVYVPKDKRHQYPMIMMRTPYSVAPYGLDKYIDEPGNQRSRYFHEGYILVYQDVRGRYMSEGEYVNVRPYLPTKPSNRDVDETTDTYDTVDWLVKNVPLNNGRVGISGISYPGFYSSMGVIDAHPAVKAASPQAPVSKWMGGDDFFHNGAFLLSHAFDFFSSFGWPRPAPKMEPDPRFDHKTPDGYEFFLEMGPLPNANVKYLKNGVTFWNEIMEHGTWDAFWEARNILPHFRNIKPAVMVVGGWFDTENLYGALHTYEAIKQQDPGARDTLVMGPWSHGEWSRSDGQMLGDIDFGSKTADYYTERVEVPFFNYYLKDQGKLDLPGAFVFETGANQWRSLDSWPPKDLQAKDLYLQADGSLSWEPPAGSAPDYREYVNDPSKPVPYTSEITNWYNPSFMLQDQRFAATRPDVLVYRTDPLASAVTIAGPISASFFVSTSGTDSDWIAKVIDVFPDGTPDPQPNPRNVRLGGYEMMVRGDVLRGKFRNSLSAPEPFVPGQVTKIEFELQDVFHTFKEGHRIMVQVQSTWFPMIDLNPQKFVDVYRAQAADFQKATQRVYSSREYPSHVRFGLSRK
ncbi:MAG: CocE/NonD family hydrolase [Acidobacteriia bacterium]|nr:CocE/NonD family hydrolase [Terriglobia bacterium]